MEGKTKGKLLIAMLTFQCNWTILAAHVTMRMQTFICKYVSLPCCYIQSVLTCIHPASLFADSSLLLCTEDHPTIYSVAANTVACASDDHL